MQRHGYIFLQLTAVGLDNQSSASNNSLRFLPSRSHPSQTEKQRKNQPAAVSASGGDAAGPPSPPKKMLTCPKFVTAVVCHVQNKTCLTALLSYEISLLFFYIRGKCKSRKKDRKIEKLVKERKRERDRVKEKKKEGEREEIKSEREEIKSEREKKRRGRNVSVSFSSLKSSLQLAKLFQCSVCEAFIERFTNLVLLLFNKFLHKSYYGLKHDDS